MPLPFIGTSVFIHALPLNLLAMTGTFTARFFCYGPAERVGLWFLLLSPAFPQLWGEGGLIAGELGVFKQSFPNHSMYSFIYRSIC